MCSKAGSGIDFDKQTFEKVVKEVVPSVLSYSGFVIDPTKKYANLAASSIQ